MQDQKITKRVAKMIRKFILNRQGYQYTMVRVKDDRIIIDNPPIGMAALDIAKLATGGSFDVAGIDSVRPKI